MNELQIFMNAPRNTSAEDLKSYLDKACGTDRSLRKKVESLFQADKAAEKGFMKHPAVEIDKEAPSVVIGRYKLLQEIGQGGFGVVYMADQEKPVKRRVALKILKTGMDTRQVVARFEAERQALAMMDHPNIARVLDGGATNEGRPYFVMELVKGIPITQHCEQENLGIDARLRLFTQVCLAVQHAHGKGIIHRDLKPSNILVTIKDGEPVPKVIDFGIAKAIDQRLTEKTLFTRYEQMIGTPTYMSPEQAALSGVDLDTRSDIYSLGVLLYELLTGTTPFDTETLRSATFDEMRRIIREDEPPKPSTKLSRTLLVADFKHRPQMMETMRSLRGDLDWVVMKCLDKDRGRRYETANGLRLDIVRYLGNKPVSACPPSPWYQLKKLAKRNKMTVSAIFTVLTALFLGLAVSLWGWNDANHSRRIANEQRKVADDSKREADQQRAQALKKAEELARQVYLMQLANADKAILDHNLVRAETELQDIPEEQRGWEWRFLKKRLTDHLSDELPHSEQPFFTSDGKHIVAMGHGNTPETGSVIVREIDSLRRVNEFHHDKELMNLALSPLDQWLAAGDIDGNLVLWDFKTRKKQWQIIEAPRIGHTGIAQGHDGSRIGLAFSPDGKQVASANFSTTLKVFDVIDGRETFSIELGTLIRKLMFSPDGRWIAAGSDPAVLVDTRTSRVIPFPKGEKVPTFSPQGNQIATGNPSSRIITLWDWNGKSLEPNTSWKGGNSSRFFDLCYLHDGIHLASAQGMHVMIWNLQTHKLEAYVRPSFADWLAASPQGDTMAICGAKTRGGGGPGLYLWHFSGKIKHLVSHPQERTGWLLMFSPDNTKIAVGSHRGQQGMSALEKPGPIIILDVDSTEIIATIDLPCKGFAWMPDSRNLAVTSSTTETHEIYDTMTGRLVRRFEGPLAIGKPFVDQSGQRLISIGHDRSQQAVIRVWDIKTGRLRTEEETILGPIFDIGAVRQTLGGFWNMAIASHGNTVAISGGLGQTRLWDTRTQKELTIIYSRSNAEDTLAFTEDSQCVYFSGQEGFGLYDIGTSKMVSEFVGPTGSVAVSPDKHYVVSCGKETVIWDISHGLPLMTLSDAADSDFVSAAWSPNKQRIAAGANDGTVHFWTLPVAPED